MAEQERVTRKWLSALEEEVSGWMQDDLISQNQARAILSRYDGLREREKEEGRSKLVTALAIMGALLLGVGVILFFASNWQVMPKWLKVGLVFGSFIAAYGIGYYLAFGRQNYPRTGRAVIFLGTVLYGSGIWLIAQIFHISSHYPNGVILWAVGIFPIILITGSLSVLLECSVLLLVWTFMEQTGFRNANLLYLPAVAAALAVSYQMRSGLAVGINLVGIALWLFIGHTVALDKSGDILYVLTLIGLYGLMVLMAGKVQSLQPRLLRMVLPFKIVGILLMFISLFMLSFRFLVDDARQMMIGRDIYPTYFLTVFILIVAATLAAAVYYLYKSKNDGGRPSETVFVIVLTAALVALTFAARYLDIKTLLIIDNLLLFAAVAAVVVIGYLNREPIMINAGLLFFVFDVIARYFDFFWDMLPKSVFFMAGGLLLLAGGLFLERNRRKIVREMAVNDYAA